MSILPMGRTNLSLYPRYYTPYMPAVGLKGELSNEHSLQTEN
jgi:hypothetical protein